MKRRTVRRNLVWGAVFGTSAFGITQSLAHMPVAVVDAGLAWLVVAMAGLLMLLTLVFGFMLGIFPVLVTLFIRDIITGEEKRGRSAVVALFMIEEYIQRLGPLRSGVPLVSFIRPTAPTGRPPHDRALSFFDPDGKTGLDRL